MDPAPADVLVRVHRELLVDRGERAHEDLAVREIEAARGHMPIEFVDDADAYGELRLRVVVDLYLTHVRLCVVPVQPLDLELLRLVEIDRLLVEQHLRGEPVDLADHPRLAVVILGADRARCRPRRVDDDNVVVRRRAQRRRLRRERLIGPVVLATRLVEHALLVEVREHAGRVLRSEPLARLERDLERGALQVVHQHVQVVGIHQTRFGRAAEHVLGMLDDVLIGGG